MAQVEVLLKSSSTFWQYSLAGRPPISIIFLSFGITQAPYLGNREFDGLFVYLEAVGGHSWHWGLSYHEVVQ